MVKARNPVARLLRSFIRCPNRPKVTGLRHAAKRPDPQSHASNSIPYLITRMIFSCVIPTDDIRDVPRKDSCGNEGTQPHGRTSAFVAACERSKPGTRS